jgi:hypothetical protein
VHNTPAKEELKATTNAHYQWDRLSHQQRRQFRTASVPSSRHLCPVCLKNDFSSLEALRMHQNTKQHFIDCDDCFFTDEAQQQHLNAKHLVMQGRHVPHKFGKHIFL